MLFALVALLAAACGREAIPRVATSPAVAGRQEAALPTTADTPTPAAAQPAPAATSAQPNGDPRAQGDPSAPITVIEYGDYQ